MHGLTFSLLVVSSIVGCGPSGPADAGTDVPTVLDAPLADVAVDDAPGDAPADAGEAAARLVVLSREGEIASMDLTAPYTVRASADLGAPIVSVRCAADRCVVVHPSPIDRLSIVDAVDLSFTTVALERGSDPRDVVIVDRDTLIVSHHERSALSRVVLGGATTPIDLGDLADADGLPEAGRMARCGGRAYVQLGRLDHTTGLPSVLGAALAVVELSTGALVDADPTTAGTQPIALAGRAAFDMPADCDAGRLWVVEPRPLMLGGSHFERVDLATLSASDLEVQPGAEAGGLEVAAEGLYWSIEHTEFGPGPSSHLVLVDHPDVPAHNTFSSEHVNDLALDHPTDQLFYPDPCATLDATCPGGVHVFASLTGAHLTPDGVDVGFPPIELAIAR